MHIQRLQGDLERNQGIYYEFDIHANPLGVGGMGKVYLGSRVVEESGKRTPVAIKAMYEDLPEHIIERAKRESSIQIKHENLVEMMGFVEKIDVNSNGYNVKHYHVISEYIDGVSLYDILQGNTKNQFGVELEAAKDLYKEYTEDKLKVSLRIIRQVLSAIMSLHDNGYIHRDIDPSNIMVTAKGTIKLIDFGIAKRLATLGTQDKMVTSAGVFMGKAQYAAPELVTGDVKNQDVTTDIYSIGILLYQLLIGNLPFEGSIPEILDAQLHKKMPVKNVGDKDIRAIIKKATEKKQGDRYRSAAEFRVALDDLKFEHKRGKSKICTKIAMYATIILVLVSATYIILKYFPSDKKSIDSKIVDVYEISKHDYKGLEDIANAYYNNVRLPDYYEEKGNYLIDSKIAKKYLQKVDDNISDNYKIAIVLYSELIEKSDDDNAIDDYKNKLNTLIDRSAELTIPAINDNSNNKGPAIQKAINSEIAYIYGINAFDYSGLKKIADEYYQNNELPGEYKGNGMDLIESTFGQNILHSNGSNTEYSNLKVAFILYVELKNIAEINNDNTLLAECDKCLNQIEKLLKY